MKTQTTIEQLISFKKKYNLKQTTLSTMMNVNKYTLHRWLTGKFPPNSISEQHILRFLKNNH